MKSNSSFWSTVITVLCIVLGYSNTVVAQSAAIKGKVLGVDAADAPIVTLLTAQDSAMVKTSISEPDGTFEFDLLKEGRYLVSITSLGYTNYVSDPVELTTAKPTVQLEDIVLVRSSTELKEVEVVAQKAFVQRKIDRIVINPDALISNTGSTALEVLEKAPGVMVDMNGNISLKGKPGVLVFIDDKPSYMAAADLAGYLRSLPSGSIESIEIMSNPPAKYEAAGNAGIINIKLKRSTEKGFNGGINVGYGQGRYMRSNNSFNFNYSVKNISFFSNISWAKNGFYHDLTINRQYYTPGGDYSSGFTSNSYMKRISEGRGARVGLDYYLSKKSTIGAVVTGFFNPAVNHVFNKAQALDSNNQPVLLVEAVTPSKITWKNGSINLNYLYKIDDKNKELSANIDYITYNSEQSQQLINSTFTPDHVPLSQSVLKSTLPVTITIQSAKLDYAHPLAKLGKLDAGAKISMVSTDNTASFYDVVNDVATPNYEFSNRFKYKENIHAGYLNYSKEWQKFSLQFGLRVENTAITGNQLGNAVTKDSVFQRNYTNAFPTLYLSYRLDSAQKNQFGFSFGRRIERPDYQDLNPFTYPLDRYTYYAGNPFLKPTFSYYLELSHTYKSVFTTTLDYSIANNAIQETNEQRGNIYYSRPGNYGSQVVYGISVNGNLKVTKWWTIQLYSELKNVAIKSLMYGQKIDEEKWYWHIGPTNQFTLSKKLNVEVGGFYNTRILSGQFLMLPLQQVNVGASYKVLKDKGTIKLNVSDVFYIGQRGGDIRNIANSKANWYSYLDSRAIYIGFAYRFSKGKARQARETGASDTEKNRVKTN
jgi:iron complex outermembrane receptor protein